MSTWKDYLKSGVVTLLIMMIAFFASGFYNKMQKINDSATKKDIEQVEVKCNNYTIEVMSTHEKKELVRDAAIDAQYQQIQSDLTLIKKYLIEKE